MKTTLDRLKAREVILNARFESLLSEYAELLKLIVEAGGYDHETM